MAKTMFIYSKVNQAVKLGIDPALLKEPKKEEKVVVSSFLANLLDSPTISSDFKSLLIKEVL